MCNNTKTKLCVYMISLSYVLVELIKLWQTYYSGTYSGIPLYFIIPVMPILIGLILNLLSSNRNEK
jgi:hypothetical protein